VARKLFTGGSAKDKNWIRRTAIAGGRHKAIWGYTTDYYEAAESLVEAVLQHNKPADLLFCPILYLYRHFIEEMLKHLIRQAEGYCRLLDQSGIAHTPLKESVIPELNHTHSLKKLLQWLVQRVEIVDSKEPFDKEIRDTIEELHNFDPDGQTFRYAYRNDKKTKKDSLTLPKQEQYDIENIRRRMKEVNDYLCGTEDWLDFNCQMARES
jgi:hypothetical protein